MSDRKKGYALIAVLFFIILIGITVIILQTKEEIKDVVKSVDVKNS
jgi:hypothetical protein